MEHVEIDPSYSRLRRLPRTSRRALAVSLAGAALAYCGLLLATYVQLTPSSAVVPDLREVARLLSGGGEPISRIERLLESDDGPLSRSGTMRPAFTDQSTDWDRLVQGLTPEATAALLADREGERLAMLDWVRCGASRQAYEADEYCLSDMAAISKITADYRSPSESLQSAAPRQVRIRSLLHDRCVTCHGENGRHDIARFIELDTYDRLWPHLQPEPEALTGRNWLIAALTSLFPLSLISAPIFFLTSQSRPVRAIVIAFTLAGQVAMTVAWIRGPTTPLTVSTLLLAAAVAAIGAIVQIAASVLELLAIERSH